MARIKESEGPPPGVPATGLTVLFDQIQGGPIKYGRMMRPRLTLPRLAALLLLPALIGLGGLLALASAQSPQATDAATAAGRQNANTSAGERANKEAAARDAQALLAKLRLPPGARRTRTAPRGAGSTLGKRGPTIPSPDVVDRHAFWIVPAGAQETLAFLEAHAPSGSQLQSSGSGSGGGLTTSWSLGFVWPPVPSVLYARSLSVVLVALGRGSTAIRADAADMWDLPKPASERIPSRARVLDVSVGRPDAPPSFSLRVTDRVKVKRIAKAIDRLPTVQPIAIACPNIPVDARTVTFTFRAITGGPALAQAGEPASASGPVSPCEPMDLTISGRVFTPLLGGAVVVEQAQTLLGVTLRQAR